MSCSWHIHCVDCDDTQRFDSSNHADAFMLALCRHADALANLADISDDSDFCGDLELRRFDDRIDLTWFAKHLGHNLMPIDEHGRLYGKCIHQARCGHCKAWHRCALERNHEGEHAFEVLP